MKTAPVVFFPLIYSSPSLALSLPLYVFKARPDSKKTQQLIDFCTVQHSIEQALTFQYVWAFCVLIGRQPCECPHRNKRKKRNQSVEGPHSLTSVSQGLRMWDSFSAFQCLLAVLSHVRTHTHRYQSNLSQHYLWLHGGQGKKKVCRETEEVIHLSKNTHLIL